ncbi:histidine kinase-like ATPase [Tribonema minus]|uniref:Histidine kinase-like ATPase n=1 Tax=Tribonema minus TaxID=303371 RepID=A0A835ZHA2_9STRA|nr:histidine kinase-like ATPase [Tribonema minus]
MGVRGTELIARKKDGSEMHVEVSLSPLSVGGDMHTIAIVRDVTEQLQLREAQEVALASTLAKSSFLAAMSHEIRTPLHGVVGWVDILDNMAVEEEQRACLKGLKQCADSLMHIVNDVLDMSKISAGKMVLQKHNIDVHDFAHDIHATMAVIAERKGLSLTTTTSSLSSSLAVATDAPRLRQVIVNLVINAIKYTKRGGVNVVYTMQGSSELHIVVSDTGTGIVDSKMAVLFEPFELSTGTGLGLSICKSLVSLLQGTLSCVTEVGAGSTFTVTVPVQITELPLSAKHAVAPAGFVDKVVLVVDDSKVNRSIAQHMLKLLGVKTEIATDGLEAVQYFVDGHTASLTLMDLIMPLLGGCAATKQLREMGVTIPIVAVSASAFVHDVEECLASGMNDHLSKPFTSQQLQDMLHKWM